jgi:hypothetical protein
MEKWQNKNVESPLGEDVAQEEANMMKAKLEGDELGRKLTAEDYDKALEVVEEIKRMAEEEPTTEKILFKFARLTAKSAYGVQKILTYLSTLPDSFIATGGIKREEKETLKKFEDAASELRKLRDEAKKFETEAENE